MNRHRIDGSHVTAVSGNESDSTDREGAPYFTRTSYIPGTSKRELESGEN